MSFDTFSPNLGILLPGTGNDAGSWGSYTNTNLGTIVEAAISGYAVQTFANINVTLTIPSAAASTAGNMTIECQGTLGGTTTYLYLPANKKLYFIYNNTSDAQALNVMVSTGTNVVQIPNGARALLVCNGTDVNLALNYYSGVFSGTLVGNVTGNLTGNVTGNLTGNVTGNVTGNTSGTAAALNPGRNINGVLFDGTSDITITAASGASQLTGNTLASNVLYSSLTRVGAVTVGSVTVGILTGNFAPGANGLATVATSGSAANLTGTLPTASLPAVAYRNTLGSGNVTIVQTTLPSGGSDGDLWLVY